MDDYNDLKDYARILEAENKRLREAIERAIFDLEYNVNPLLECMNTHPATLHPATLMVRDLKAALEGQE